MAKDKKNKPKLVEMKKSNEAIEKEYRQSIHAFESLNAALELAIAGVKVYAIQYPHDKNMAYGSHQAIAYVNNLMQQHAKALCAQRELLGKDPIDPEDTVGIFRALLKEERGMDDATLDFLQHHYHKPEDKKEPRAAFIEKLSDEELRNLRQDQANAYYAKQLDDPKPKKSTKENISKLLEDINKEIANDLKKDKDGDESV